MDGFFFNDTATPEIYTLSLHDALPICLQWMSAGTASSWDAKIIIGERSEHSPSLAFFNGTFYIAWTGTDDQHHVNVMSSSYEEHTSELQSLIHRGCRLRLAKKETCLLA